MIALRVTPPVEEEGAEVDGVEGVGGATNPDRLEHSCALVRLIVAVLMEIGEHTSEIQSPC